MVDGGARVIYLLIMTNAMQAETTEHEVEGVKVSISIRPIDGGFAWEAEYDGLRIRGCNYGSADRVLAGALHSTKMQLQVDSEFARCGSVR